MIKIREAIVVEGRYDKNTLSQVVDAPIFQTDGFGIMNDKQQMDLLRRVAQKRGLIVFTDSDGAGFVIRNKLKSCIPGEYLLHAYIPDIPGKERRKAAPGKEGKLGVEGMTPQIILESLRKGRLSRAAPPSDTYHKYVLHYITVSFYLLRTRRVQSAHTTCNPSGFIGK